VDLISDALQFGGLWYTGQNAIDNAIGYAKFRSRQKNVGSHPTDYPHHETAIRMLISNKSGKKKSTLATTFSGRSHDAVIRVYDDAGNVIEMHEHAGEFKEW
jgi:hypothetical protein